MPNLPCRVTPCDIRFVEVAGGAGLAVPSVAPIDIYGALLADAISENTRKSREYDVRVFARWLRLDGRPAEACALFISGGRGTANAIGLAFRKHEMARGIAPGSINRRISMLRKVVALARRFDLVDWVIDVPTVPNKRWRDTRGPTMEEWRRFWAAAVAAGDGPAALRNRAIIRLLRDVGLRASEVLGLDYPGDVELDGVRGGRVAVVGKGYAAADREWVTIGAAAARELARWVAARWPHPGPLFLSRPERFNVGMSATIGRIRALRAEGLSFARVAGVLNDEGRPTPQGKAWRKGPLSAYWHRRCAVEPASLRAERLVVRELNRIFLRLSEAAGVREVRPHGLRHHAITRILDLTNGNVRAAQRFARHAKPETTMRYDDNRLDLAGEMARKLGADD